MKNLLYALTIIFNAIGILCSTSLIFTTGAKGIDYLPIIVAGCIVFTLSFTVTSLDFNHRKKNRKNYKIIYQNRNNVIDCKDYFTSHKYDFII